MMMMNNQLMKVTINWKCREFWKCRELRKCCEFLFISRSDIISTAVIKIEKFVQASDQ